MSDFDKEAEREKLREKYDQDQEEREATERMSDLLLKGATMTNAHCGTCGDPIFRHEGQEFCPTCQEVLREDGEPVDGAEDGDQPADDDATTGPDEPAAATSDTEAAAGRDGAATDRPAASPPDAGSAASPDTDAPPSPDARTDARVDRSPGEPTDATRPSSSVSTGDVDDVSGAPETTRAAEADLADARAALSATVTELAANARQSGDLERKRAYLAAVEEAADALAAVRHADR